MRVAVARPSGSDLVTVSGTVPDSLLPLGGPARDRRSAEVLRRRAEEPPARRRDRAHRQRRRARRARRQRLDPRGDDRVRHPPDARRSPTSAARASTPSRSSRRWRTRRRAGGRWEGALTLARQFLATLGLEAARFDLHDGSGLSANNRVSAGDLVSFLEAMNTHPQGAALAVDPGRLGGGRTAPCAAGSSIAGAVGRSRPRPAP